MAYLYKTCQRDEPKNRRLDDFSLSCKEETKSQKFKFIFEFSELFFFVVKKMLPSCSIIVYIYHLKYLGFLGAPQNIDNTTYYISSWVFNSTVKNIASMNILNQFWILAQFYTKVVVIFLKMSPKVLTFLVRQDLHTISNGLLVLCTFSTLLMCLLHSRYVNVIDSIIKNIFTSQQIVYYKSKTGYNPREIGLI